MDSFRQMEIDGAFNLYPDPILDGIHDTRRRIFAACGNDIGNYFEMMRREEAEAASLGMSYTDYCLNKIESRSGSARARVVAPQATNN